MPRYLLIESRDPFASQDSLAFYELAEGLVKAGNAVTLFLIQNGVLPVRKGSKYADRLAEMLQNNLAILADDFSLKERAIRDVTDGTKRSSVEELVDLAMSEETKIVWH